MNYTLKRLQHLGTVEADSKKQAIDEAIKTFRIDIARIDRRYVVVWPLQHRSETRATMAAVFNLALAEMARACD